MKAQRQLLLFLLLAFTLLFAQQGAVIHALSHLSEPLPTQSQQDKQLPHSPACDKCVVYAGVSTALASSELSFAATADQVPYLAATPPALLSQPARLYRARAPPALV